MATMTQLNTRIDAEVKRRGDAVFAREGLTPSQVVRSVWQYAADTQRMPDCVRPAIDADRQRRVEAIRRGAGLASRMLKEQFGIELSPADEPFDYKAYRSHMYDEMIEEMESCHAEAECAPA